MTTQLSEEQAVDILYSHYVGERLRDPQLADINERLKKLGESIIRERLLSGYRALLAASPAPQGERISEGLDRAIHPGREHGNNATIPCTAGVASSTSDPQQPTDHKE